MNILKAALSRRAALGRIMGGAALAPTLAQNLASSAISAQATAPLKPLTEGAMVPPSASPISEAEHLLRKPLRWLHAKTQGDFQDRVMYRQGPFDPDIAALNSLPYASRVRMQQHRDKATRSQLDGLREKLGWF